MYDTKSCGYGIIAAILWALGIVVFVNAFHTQWTGGGAITTMAIGYYFVAVLLMGAGACGCCKAMCKTCHPPMAKPKQE